MANSQDNKHSNQRGLTAVVGTREGIQPAVIPDVNSEPTIATIESWQLLNRIIPRGARAAIAYGLHVSEEWVSRWCREPQPGKLTGSPIDRTCQLIDEVLKHNRLGAAFIPEFIANHYRKRVQENKAPSFESTERREVAADLLRRGVEAVNSLNVEGATEPTLRELVELIEVAVQAKDRVVAELAGRPNELRGA